MALPRFNKMSVALNATGRGMVYSMCNWGEDQPWNWATVIKSPRFRFYSNLSLVDNSELLAYRRRSYRQFQPLWWEMPMHEHARLQVLRNMFVVVFLPFLELWANLLGDSKVCSIARVIDFAAPVIIQSSPGGWNDLDLLTVCVGVPPSVFVYQSELW